MEGTLMSNMKLIDAAKIVKTLLHEREQMQIDADGSYFKVCPTDDEWDAIEELLNAVEGEF
jgi:uncharacterized protein YrzB (UPF0473 family)